MANHKKNKDSLEPDPMIMLDSADRALNEELVFFVKWDVVAV